MGVGVVAFVVGVPLEVDVWVVVGNADVDEGERPFKQD